MGVKGIRGALGAEIQRLQMTNQTVAHRYTQRTRLIHVAKRTETARSVEHVLESEIVGVS